MSAELLMKEHRYREAITAFEDRLAADPQDLVALLRLGLCHLLSRSENTFRAIYHQARQLLDGMQEVPEQTARLWSHYQQLFLRVAASTVILASAAGLAGCPTESAHRYSGGVYEGEGEAEDGGEADTSSAHRYSGGVYEGEGEEDGGEADTSSAHRYSGGVYEDTGTTD